MKEKQPILFLAIILVFFMNTICIYATGYEITGDGRVLSNYLSSTCKSDSNCYNYQIFEVYSTEDREYFAEFWLLPAIYSDGSYTDFNIYVNDILVGHITPLTGNWQSSRMNGNQKIFLTKGINTIKIAVLYPETPSVETIRLATYDSDAKIQSKAYDEFLDNSASGASYFISEQENFKTETSYSSQSIQTSEISMKHFSNVPLIYTFYKEFIFQEGDTINVSSSSLCEHDVDIIYTGKQNIQFRESNTELDIHSSTSPNGITLSGNTRSIDTTINRPIRYIKDKNIGKLQDASSEELQGLNWKSISTKSGQNETNLTSKFIKIPKTGYYLIRLRHRESGKTGIADLIVNGKYTYRNVPISFTWMPCVIPANGKEYGTMTSCNDTDRDDPLLFIHGAAADRIVGYADDAKKEFCEIHNLSAYDSHILQEYQVPTSGLSVSNYSSLNPESTCEIIAGVDESQFILDLDSQGPIKKTKATNSAQLPNETKDDIIICALEHNRYLTVISQSDIKDIIVYELYGTIVAHITGQGKQCSIPTTEFMNLTKGGIFVVCVETERGIFSKKIIME